MILKRSLCLMAAYGLLQMSQVCYAAESSETSTTTEATPASMSETVTAPEMTKPQAMPTKEAETMGRDIWLEKLKMGAPSMICKNFSEEADIGKVMKSKEISVDKCMALITPITEKCEDQYRNSIPDPINEELASTWGRKIGECIGGQFATQYLYPEDTTGTTPTQQTSAPAPTESTSKN